MSRGKRTVRKIAQPLDIECPDCAGRRDDRGIYVHSDGCPIGASVNAVVDEDRDWFDADPLTDERWRPASWGELETIRMLALAQGQPDPLEGMIRAKVNVTQIRPGIRTRATFVTSPRGTRWVG